MADTVEVVIKIDRETYNACVSLTKEYEEDDMPVSHAIANGTVLPKGYEPYFLKEVKVSIRGKVVHRLYDCQRHLLIEGCLSAENAKLLGIEILADDNEVPNVLYEVDKESE